MHSIIIDLIFVAGVIALLTCEGSGADEVVFQHAPNTARRPKSAAEANQHPQHPSKHSLGVAQDLASFVPPTAFDAGAKWPACTSIKTIRNQGQCGDCWAVSAASVIADRECISGVNTDFVSGSQVAGCTDPTSSPANNCNAGNDPAAAFRSAAIYGVASGGEYNSSVGCVPYSIPPAGNAVQTISCQTACTNSKFTTSTLPMDNTKHQPDTYWTSYLGYSLNQAQINSQVLLMQKEIFTNGPIIVSIDIYPDFFNWNGTGGPYAGPAQGLNSTGGHALRCVGWNQTAAGVKYWILANSWGTGAPVRIGNLIYTSKAGINGYFWVKMGSNVIGIEGWISAPVITSTTSCSKATFCSAPVSQAITMDLTKPASTYLFQGDCLLQVSKTGGKVIAVGSAMPVAKQIIGAPATPIVGYAILTSNHGLWLINNVSAASTDCALGSPPATKYGCTGGGTYAIRAANAYFSLSGQTWAYRFSGLNSIWAVSGTTGASIKGWSISSLFTSSVTTMTTVNAALDIDGASMYVFGTNAAGSPMIGVMAYPAGMLTTNTFKWTTVPGPAANLQTC